MLTFFHHLDYHYLPDKIKTTLLNHSEQGQFENGPRNGCSPQSERVLRGEAALAARAWGWSKLSMVEVTKS